MKILVLAGDYWHPMEVVKRGIERMNLDPERYEFDFVEDAKDIVTKELMAEQDLIIFAKMNEIAAFNRTPMFEKGNAAMQISDYREYVENGGVLFCVHAGNTGSPEETPEWVDFVGNSFIMHPDRCDVKVYPVMEHPITKDVEPFTEIDEHYILGNIAEDIEVFLKSDSVEGGTQISGYTKKVGKGQVCVLIPGHTMNVWANKEFGKLFVNAIEWCADQVIK